MKACSLVLAACFAAASASILDRVPLRARGGKLWQDLVAKETAAEAAHGILRNSTPNYYDQLFDHSDPSQGTFKQKWYIDATQYDPSAGRVLLYISGEGPAGGSPGGYAALLGQQLGSALVTLEHRYYGESLPYPLTNLTAMKQTLRVETVMQDIAAFLLYLDGQLGGEAPRTPSSGQRATKHVFYIVGGSYAGAVSAWFREKHPELVVASWSSSGVVNAVYNFTAFDEQLVKDVSNECYTSIRAAFDAAEAAWTDPVQRAALITQFGSADYFTLHDFMWMLADSAAMGPQYGAKDALCGYMVPQPADPLAAFAQWTNTHYGPTFGASCYYSTVCMSTASMSDQWAGGAYPWVYQCCSELAYWQASYPGSMRSQLITTDYYLEQCQEVFGSSTFANTSAFNAAFGGAAPNATRVIALQGSDDPWQGAGVQAPLGPLYPEATATCDGCGHCGDLRTPSANDPATITAQRKAIAQYMTTWVTAG